eukprot:873615-Rhodomonas_salina.4
MLDSTEREPASGVRDESVWKVDSVTPRDATPYWHSVAVQGRIQILLETTFRLTDPRCCWSLQ